MAEPIVDVFDPGLVAVQRREILHRFLERGGFALVVLDDPEITPSDLGLDGLGEAPRPTMVLPILPYPPASPHLLRESTNSGREPWAA